MIDIRELIKVAKTSLLGKDHGPEFDAVVEQLDSLITHAETGTDGWAQLVVFRAGLHIRNGRPEKASAVLGPLLRRDDALARNTYAHNTYANALIAEERSRGALNHLAPLLERGALLAWDSTAHNTYAKALLAANRPQKAADHMKPLLTESGPLCRDHYAHVTYANALVACGKANDAVSHLWPLLDNGAMLEKDAAAHCSFAAALTAAGRPDEAMAHIGPLLQPSGLLENVLVAHITYANALMTNGNPNDAVAHLTTKTPAPAPCAKHPYVFPVLCRALVAAGRENEALALGVQYVGKKEAGWTRSYHAAGLGNLMALVPSDPQKISTIKRNLYALHGERAVEKAEGLAQKWARELANESDGAEPIVVTRPAAKTVQVTTRRPHRYVPDKPVATVTPPPAP